MTLPQLNEAAGLREGADWAGPEAKGGTGAEKGGLLASLLKAPEMAMDQYQLIAFLGGWASIYQLFWGSLGTRVLTHPQMCNGSIATDPNIEKMEKDNPTVE